MSDLIYILVEGVGEYSDRSEEQIAWYIERADAEAHKAALEARQVAENAKQPIALKSDHDWSIATVERGKWPFPLPVREPGWTRSRSVTLRSSCGQSVTADVPAGLLWPFVEVPALSDFWKVHGNRYHDGQYCGTGIDDPAAHEWFEP